MGKAAEVLLVEDNLADIHLLKNIFERGSLPTQVHVVTDGEAALDWLRQHDEEGRPRMPDLVLLDLNLPRLGGFEVLGAVKRDPELRGIPVVVLSSSEAPADVAKSYELQANAYVTKPVRLHELRAVMDSLSNFWLGTAQRPSPPE